MSRHHWSHTASDRTDFWTCRVCGAGKNRGPHTMHNGREAIGWSYRDAYGYNATELPKCLGYDPLEEDINVETESDRAERFEAEKKRWEACQ